MRRPAIFLRAFLYCGMLALAPAMALCDDQLPSGDAPTVADAPAGDRFETPTLPWDRARRPVLLPGQTIDSAKEYLELLGIDASQWSNLVQEEPLGPGDDEPIAKILFNMPRIAGNFLHRWRQTDWNFDEVVAQPRRFQGNTLQLTGRATHIERVKLPAEMAERYQYSQYYRVSIVLGSDHTAIVCTRSVPKAWESQTDLDERVEALGVFLKTSPRAEGPTNLVFAARRVAWLPDRAQEAAGVTPDQVFLASRGFDVGLLDPLKGRQLRTLGETDREPFYALLHAMQEIEAGEPALHDAPPLSIARSLTAPQEMVGSLVSVEGAVRRIDRVEVTDADVRSRFGIDHYFTLYVFAPMASERIKYLPSKDDPEPMIFDNSFPVTVCVPSLPPGLAPSPTLHEPVRLQGVFFRVWAFRPQADLRDLDRDDAAGPAREESQIQQPSPLVIAPTVSLVNTSLPTMSPATGTAIGLAFLAVLGVVWIAVWRFTRSDEKFGDTLRKRVFHQDKVDLSQLARDEAARRGEDSTP